LDHSKVFLSELTEMFSLYILKNSTRDNFSEQSFSLPITLILFFFYIYRSIQSVQLLLEFYCIAIVRIILPIDLTYCTQKRSSARYLNIQTQGVLFMFVHKLL